MPIITIVEPFIPPISLLILVVGSRALAAASGYWIRETDNIFARIVGNLSLISVLYVILLIFIQEGWQPAVGLFVFGLLLSNICFFLIAWVFGTDNVAFWGIATFSNLFIVILIILDTISIYFPQALQHL